MTNSYQYNCIDKSILLPYYKNYYVTPFFRIVPEWLTANFITILSSGFVVGMTVISIIFETSNSSLQALIFAFCLHTYLLGDHLDGMQAKESGTSSPLGEFLDHYLDVYNGAIVFFTLLIFLGPIPRNVFIFLMVLNCIAFAATMVEELENQMLVFGYLGTLEGVLVLMVFYVSWIIPPVRELWQKELAYGYPAYWIIIMGLGLGYVGTIVDIIIRLGRVPGRFFLYCAGCGILAYLLVDQPISELWAWLLLILFSGDYIARVMQGYLLSGPHPYPDIVASLMILLVLIGKLVGIQNDKWMSHFFLLLSIWLICKVAYAFVSTVYKLREHWHWVNPKTKAGSAANSRS